MNPTTTIQLEADFIDATAPAIAPNPAFGYGVCMIGSDGNQISEFMFADRGAAIRCVTAFAAHYPYGVYAAAVVSYVNGTHVVAVRGLPRALVAAGLIDEAGRFRSI